MTRTTNPTPSSSGCPGPGHGRAHDLALLTTGGYTGWWDERGEPAPWPEDFLDPDSGWTPTGSEAPATPDPGKPHS